MLSAGLLAACGVGSLRSSDPGSGTAASQASGAFEYLTSFSDYQQTTYQPLLVDAFHRAHPRVQVRLLGADGSNVALATLLAAGTPPDVIGQVDPDKYLSRQIQDITERVKRDKVDLSVFAREAFEANSTWKGKVFSLPQHFSGGGGWPVIPFNRDLFRQAGVPEPPEKWGDPGWNAQKWLEALQKTTRRDADGSVLSFGMNDAARNQHLATNFWPGLWKGAWLSDDLKTVVCDSPQMIDAFELLMGMVTRHGVFGTDAQIRESFGIPDQHQAFIAGKLAMHYSSGPRTVIQVSQAVKQGGLPVAFAPLPTFAAVGAAHYMRGHGIVTGARNPDAAWTYVKWLTETPNFPISRGEPPARTDFFDVWAKELYDGIATQIRLGVYKDSLRFVARRDPLSFLPGIDQIKDQLIVPGFNRVRAGQVSVANLLRELKPQLQAVIPKDLP